MQAHMTNTRNTPVESLEHAYPLRVESLSVRRGSGGRGRFRGGEGMTRTIELLVPARVTVIAERRTMAPWGLAGGQAGSKGQTRTAGPKRARRGRTMPGKFTVDAPAHTVITVASPGGGGWGRAGRAPKPRRSRRG